MKRFMAYLAHEFRLVRTTILIHAVAILEPVVLYVLLTVILVHPTLDVYVTRQADDASRALLAAMRSVASPIGQAYVNPILIDRDDVRNVRQVISIESSGGTPVAVQRFNLIDSNLVKNYRNRLTAAALKLWDSELDGRAVKVIEHTSLPQDIPYNTYFGMAMLPLAVMMSAGIIGAVLTAQEFEFRTIDEYRTAPSSAWLMLSARMVRLVISAALAAALLLLAIGIINGNYPDSIGLVALILLPVAVTGASLGIFSGLLARMTLPAFLFILITSVTSWILGSSFKPAQAFGGFYETVSRLTLNNYAVNLLFPRYYGTVLGSQTLCVVVLVITAVLVLALTMFVYQQRVLKSE